MSDLKGVPKRVILTAPERVYPTTLIAYADLIVQDGMVVKDRHGMTREATPEDLASCKTLTPTEAKVAVDAAAWRGETPAEGTRRAIVLEAIRKGDVLSDTEALEIADTVELALREDERSYPGPMAVPGVRLRDNLHLTDEQRAEFEDRLEALTDGIEKVAPDEEDEDRVQIHAGDGTSIGSLEVVLGAGDGVPYVSLIDLEHVFANLYEDITERQARQKREPASTAGEEPVEDVEDREEGWGHSIAGGEAEKALNHLIIARRETVDPQELERINHAITAAHMVLEPPADRAKEQELRDNAPDNFALLAQARAALAARIEEGRIDPYALMEIMRLA